jgi:hypothetical protein
MVRTPGTRWEPIPRTAALAWDDTLWRVPGAHLFQFPFWNEPLREFHGRPLYLQFKREGEVAGFATVTTFGLPGFRVGLLQRGPILLPGHADEIGESIGLLLPALKDSGVFCLRVTSESPKLLDNVSRAYESERGDAFPFMSSLQNDAFVSLEETESEIFARFQKQVRNAIRKCERIGFTAKTYADPGALRRYWYLFEQTADTNRFLRRPLASFCRLFELGGTPGRVELSILETGERAIGALILARDAETTYYISGGRDQALSREFGYTAHYRLWLAMLQARAAGSKQFDLGATFGSVGEYKLKFAPQVRANPTPVTLILHRQRYRLWKAIIGGQRAAGQVRGLVRRIGSLRARS